MNLYEINREIEEVLENSIDMETGEISEEAIQRLNELQMEKDQKVENVALWHKNLMAESKAIADEIMVLQARKRSLDKRMEWQKKYLQFALDGHKYESPKVAISYRKSTAVEILNEAEFCSLFRGSDWVTEKTTLTPNKTAIKDCLKNGQSSELNNWAELVEKQNMQIK